MTASAQLPGAVAVERYLNVLFGRSRASTLIDVRWRRGDERMARAFVPAGDRGRLSTVIPALAPDHDVYVGVLPRWRHAGGRDAIVGDCRTVWLDLDMDVSARALEPVEPAPSLVIASAVIRSPRSQAPRGVADACWRHVADTARVIDGARWFRRRR